MEMLGGVLLALFFVFLGNRLGYVKFQKPEKKVRVRGTPGGGSVGGGNKKNHER